MVVIKINNAGTFVKRNSYLEVQNTRNLMSLISLRREREEERGVPFDFLPHVVYVPEDLRF